MSHKQFQRSILLFDGVCGLCHALVKFLSHHKNGNRFDFVSQQSPAGEVLLEQHQLQNFKLKTVILIQNDNVWTYSDAGIRALASLGGVYRLVWAFLIVPKFLRDFLYRALAKRRYQLFGKV